MSLKLYAFKENGGTLKQLIFSSEGVLIYNGDTVFFIPPSQSKIVMHKPKDYTEKELILFVSKDFGKVQMLDNDDYIFWITKDAINVHKADTYELVMIIYGKRM
jgi:hypothetical protein